MGHLRHDEFICLDLETTGLDPHADDIIEVAAIRFTFEGTIDTFETLIDPKKAISEESMAIHNITDEMVQGKPLIAHVIPDLYSFIGKTPIVGHGISMDINFLRSKSLAHNILHSPLDNPSIDTLRLARLYGKSPTNSLQALREHFEIEAHTAHRAMGDVMVNIAVFKKLTEKFVRTEEVFKRLDHPIEMTVMPLGKYKGSPFSEIPTPYLGWAMTKEFDLDLMFTIKKELARRKSGNFPTLS